jgi:hypothetical protein
MSDIFSDGTLQYPHQLLTVFMPHLDSLTMTESAKWGIDTVSGRSSIGESHRINCRTRLSGWNAGDVKPNMAMPNEASEMKLYPGPLSYERELSLLIGRIPTLASTPCVSFSERWACAPYVIPGDPLCNEPHPCGVDLAVVHLVGAVEDDEGWVGEGYFAQGGEESAGEKGSEVSISSDDGGVRVQTIPQI